MKIIKVQFFLDKYLEKISECVRKEGLKNFLKEMEDFN
jgi:hypothetical protein